MLRKPSFAGLRADWRGEAARRMAGNAIESLNMSLRKVTKARGSFPNDEAVFKLLYLALRNIAKKWTMSVHDWKAALNRFAIVYENRLPVEWARD